MGVTIGLGIAAFYQAILKTIWNNYNRLLSRSHILSGVPFYQGLPIRVNGDQKKGWAKYSSLNVVGKFSGKSIV